jgi:hypothetical protein
MLAADARERLKELAESVAGLYEGEKRLDGHTRSRKTRSAVHDLLVNRDNPAARTSVSCLLSPAFKTAHHHP